MAQTYDHLKERAESSKGWRSSRRLRIPVDPNLDPYDIPIDEINVANPELYRLDDVEVVEIWGNH